MKNLVAASLLLFTFSACSSIIQSTPTAIPTRTAVPTLTATLLPTVTPQPSLTPDVISALLPEGQPASEWKGIPIMPGAIAGDGDEEGYVFSIHATAQQVQDYYQMELGKRGWQSFAQGNGDSSRILIFMNDASATLTVSIIAKGEDVLVLLVI